MFVLVIAPAVSYNNVGRMPVRVNTRDTKTNNVGEAGLPAIAVSCKLIRGHNF
jgi:hypothetical protein